MADQKAEETQLRPDNELASSAEANMQANPGPDIRHKSRKSSAGSAQGSPGAARQLRTGDISQSGSSNNSCSRGKTGAFPPEDAPDSNAPDKLVDDANTCQNSLIEPTRSMDCQSHQCDGAPASIRVYPIQNSTSDSKNHNSSDASTRDMLIDSKLSEDINQKSHVVQFDSNRIPNKNNVSTSLPQNEEEPQHSHEMKFAHEGLISFSSGLKQLPNGKIISDNPTTVKKGVLWQHQSPTKFHQRFFNKWTKRYFILTVDYLNCFKRSTSKVGHSEMGKFIYKIPLCDIKSVRWEKPDKNERGSIVLDVVGRFSLMLWSKHGLTEWMTTLQESVRANIVRRSCLRWHDAQDRIYREVENFQQKTGQLIQAKLDTVVSKGTDRTRTITKFTKTPLIEHDDIRPHQLASKGCNNTTPEHSLGTDKIDGCLAQEHSSAALLSSSRSEASGVKKNSVEVVLEHKLGVKERGNGLVRELEMTSSVGSSAGQSDSIESNLSNRKLQRERPHQAFKCPKDFIQGTAEASLQSDQPQIVRSLVPNEPGRNSTRIKLDNRPDLGSVSRPLSSVRRDDSWQSLISLTKVGQAIPYGGQSDGRRPLYAQNLLASSFVTGSAQQHQAPLGARNRMVDIESTVTPVRVGPLFRQLSSRTRDRTPHTSLAHHSTSLDIPDHLLNSRRANQISVLPSHHQKLLQLQLLHNANNVDYVRHGTGDNQIYAPDSTANMYGYSSMRSNLKSVASEFSFIRPLSSTGYSQTTLPHQAINQGDNQSTSLSNNQQMRSLMVTPIRQNKPTTTNNIVNTSFSSTDLNPKQQYLVHPTTGQRITYEQQQLKSMVIKDNPKSSVLAVPECRLPMKPNKRRLSTEAQAGKKSSPSTFSITGLIRRAFSRKAKTEKSSRSKMTGSFSSSLSPLNGSASVTSAIHSSLSTGSRYNDIISNGDIANGNNRRMVDMIEAFNHQTLIDGHNVTRVDVAKDKENFSIEDTDLGARKTSRLSRQQLNQFVSPLHKSNSISTTSGWGLSDIGIAGSHLDGDNNLSSYSRQIHDYRPERVMSAHLAQKSVVNDNQFDSRNNLFCSPRLHVRSEHVLPRPSSIYGQPSMISSPILTNHDSSSRFGSQRNSFHFNQHVDRISFEIRRPIARGTVLYPTVEVAEEISSPVDRPISSSYQSNRNESKIYNEEKERLASKNHPVQVVQNDCKSDPDSPISLGQLHYKQAIVNPILHSPTLATIYDNHPMLNSNGDQPSYSLYDNHNHFTHTQSLNQEHTVSRRVGMFESTNEDTHISASQSPEPFGTNIRKTDPGTEITNVSTIIQGGAKPAAIVAPSTPKNNFSSDSPHRAPDTATRHSPAHSLGLHRSPMMGRRGVVGPNYYQQSPLVSNRTRVVTKSDGVQATILTDERRTSFDVRPDASPYYVSQRYDGPPSSSSRLDGELFDSSDHKPMNRSTSSVSSAKNNRTNSYCASSSLENSSSRIGIDNFELESHGEISSGNSSAGDKISNSFRERPRRRSQQSSTGSTKRESSSEPSDGTSFNGSPGHTSERNWVTSKLVN